MDRKRGATPQRDVLRALPFAERCQISWVGKTSPNIAWSGVDQGALCLSCVCAWGYSWSLYDAIMNTFTGPSTVTKKRVTTLGATKSDIASMLWRVVEASPDAPITYTTRQRECEVRLGNCSGRLLRVGCQLVLID